jgi:hypothetical protein
VKRGSLGATEDHTEGHFRVGGLKAAMNRVEGHQYVRGPRPHSRETMDTCHVTIRGHENICKS